MEKLKIVIVDSGVQSYHKKLINDDIICLDKELNETNTASYGHGTAIYGIIRKVNDIAEIINIRLFESDSCSEEDFLETMERILINLNCDLLNLSLGLPVVSDKEKMRSIFSKFEQNGTIIVSAMDNSGKLAYPALLSNVIGVASSNKCNKINDIIVSNDKKINVFAKGGMQRVLWNDPDFIMVGGNSFAAAHVTCIVARLMSHNITNMSIILQKLSEMSLEKIDEVEGNIRKSNLSIKKAVCYPFSKEMHSLVRYNDILPFDLIEIYDNTYSMNCGMETNRLLSIDGCANYIIKNIENINFDGIDTLILGHAVMSNLQKDTEIRNRLIENARKSHINIYSLDDIENLECEYSKYYSPKVTVENLPMYRNGFLYDVVTPVVGVFGTSSKQGKFSTQLLLNKKLNEAGYKVSHLGTEPTSELFNFDFTYPMGFNSNVSISNFNAVRYLNTVMHKLDEMGTDLIIVGSQSGTVSYDFSHLSLYTPPQFEYLLGTMPDAIILCVNAYDDLGYIRRTIEFIESAIFSRVLAIVIFPVTITDNNGMIRKNKLLAPKDVKELKETLYDEFSIKSFLLSNEDFDGLVNIIVDYFGE